jgi:hypothetical protein
MIRAGDKAMVMRRDPCGRTVFKRRRQDPDWRDITHGGGRDRIQAKGKGSWITGTGLGGGDSKNSERTDRIRRK